VSISVGFIGYRNHATRLKQIVQDHSVASVGTIYYPRDLDSSFGTTTLFPRLLKEDAVIIASPSDTHYDYLRMLSDYRYSGYIFCEKPLVTSRKNLVDLRNLCLDFRKIFVNFNYRFSKFVSMFSEAVQDETIGEPFHLHAVSTQGLAFSQKYLDSWRSDKLRHVLGVTETKSIHYLDLAIFLFGNPTGIDYCPRVISGNGTAIDTSTLSIKFEQGKTATVVASYAAPLRQSMELLGSNGYLVYENENITLYGPRDTFSSDGRFDNPPSLATYSFRESTTDFHTDSLNSAMNYFLKVCCDGGQFRKVDLDRTFITTETLLNLAGQDLCSI